MFSECFNQVGSYTFPVLISTLFYDGTIDCGGGTFIVLNKEGWILTAAHIMNTNLQWIEDQTAIREYESKVREINSNTRLTPQKKEKSIKQLKYNPKWIKTFSTWWGAYGVVINNITFDGLKDIATGKIENFDAASFTSYPVFKNPDEPMPRGTSLCKLGFPFHNFTSTYDEVTNNFTFGEGTLPVQSFPIDGIFTRVISDTDKNTGRTVFFLETSTPGLKGQSGGPTFDKRGDIWALQCKTQFLNLGFVPEVVQGKKTIQEHQFINVGLGSPVTEILSFLAEHGVEVQLSANSQEESLT